MDEGAAVLPAEIWDPGTGAWTTVASMNVPRLYHSAAILLPDARVLSGGGGRCGAPTSSCTNYPNAEIYTPPYLFNADGSLAYRPSITGGPDAVGYGQSFSVQTPDSWDVGKVTLVRLSSVTHSFNMNQRFTDLSFFQSWGEVVVTAPSGPTLAPPGPLHAVHPQQQRRSVRVAHHPAGRRLYPGTDHRAGHLAALRHLHGRGRHVQLRPDLELPRGPNQQWTVPPTGVTGEVRAHDGRCLDAAGGAGNDGDEIITWPCHGGPNQQWTYTSAGELKGIHGKCADVAGWGTGNGTRVIL
ncbi:MAG: DUF1929 domain-containing protein [Gemmatimonadetes bacterium]|nr:DUF1929 domain-containing protein [Gemmatimonadota bacterium]